MKNIYLLLVVAVLLFTGCHKDIWNSINDLDSRVKALEELCREMNTNISSLQALIEVIQSGDYITNIVPITKGGEVIGYTIMFKNHEPITIYNGEDGVTANTPIIGAAQDTDGVYYWTVNGEWLLDDNGNKIRVTGRDGQNGQDGNDGQPGQPGQPGNNGQNGQNGADGITPTLKIENGMWYVSYDNGSTWTMLGQATGDPGQPGQPGQNGQDGESIFVNITYNANSVTFTLSDGTTITVPRDNGTDGTTTVPIIDGAIMAPFSVSATKQVYFSMGNLQFQPSQGMHMCADDTMRQGTFRFASRQFYASAVNGSTSPQNYWMDLFTVGVSGYNNTKVSLGGIVSPTTKYLAYHYQHNITGEYVNYDIGWFNAISNGGNEPNVWRLPTLSEMQYLFNQRADARQLCFTANIGNVFGLVILPDNWHNLTLSYESGFTNSANTNNTFSISEWALWEAEGAVFFPQSSTSTTASHYNYWTSSYADFSSDPEDFYVFNILHAIFASYHAYGTSTATGYYLPIRLVKDVPASSNN